MPIAKIRLPDGRVGRFEVPEGTTEAQVLAFAETKFAPKAQPAPAEIPPDTPTPPPGLATGEAATSMLTGMGGMVAGGLAGFQATLTLPGIAGIILTIGMAVDANVLIFERIREEMSLGKTPRAAVDAGYDRATLTILDANITTLIAALVLFQFGTGPVKGFAVTLSLGVISSLFTSLILTRLIFDYYLTKRKIKTLSI